MKGLAVFGGEQAGGQPIPTTYFRIGDAPRVRRRKQNQGNDSRLFPSTYTLEDFPWVAVTIIAEQNCQD